MPSGAEFGDNETNMDGRNAPKILTLEEELREALSQDILCFTGNYYHAQLQRSTPNPCLSISGLGTIGLPLEEDSAKRIISCANSEHVGYGTVQKPVRGIWEVDATRISFLNPAWDSYISDTLCPEVCTALGALTSAPKMELRELLLYEEGANYPAHQDPQGPDNVFATVTLLLPSPYIGGEIVLSHASNSNTIDFSPESVYASAVLAWYADVTHEVRPISSGYRLALSYNLIHDTTSAEPRPSSPKTLEAANLLRSVFLMWRGTLNSHETEQYLMTYLLDHTYDLEDIKDVLASLKGVDAYRVRVIHQVAEELKFILGVASLEYKYGPISEVVKESNSVSRLTTLDGKPLLGLSKSLWLDNNTIVMVPAAKSDDIGNTKGDNHPHQSGKRTVLLLIDKQRQDDFRFTIDGLPVAIQLFRNALKGLQEPEIVKWAKAILRCRNSSCGGFTDGVFLDIFNYALERRNLQLWLGTTSCTKWSFGRVNTGFIVKAYKTFSFEDLRERFDCLVENALYCHGSPLPLVEDITTFLRTFSSDVARDGERDALQRWCEEAVERIFDWIGPSENAQDANIVLRIIKLVGMELSKQLLIPQLIGRRDPKYFDFWTTLHVLLRDQRQDLLNCLSKSHPEPFVSSDERTTVNKEERQGTKMPTTKILDEFIMITLLIPSFDWSQVPHSPWCDFYHRRPRPPFNPNPEKINRLLLILEACIHGDNKQACEIALAKALCMFGNPIWNLSNFYIPVITRLQQILTPLNQDLSHPLFTKFIRTVVGRYLGKVLGKRGPVVDIGLRKISCDQSNCATCKKLDAFILSTQPEIQLHFEAEDCYHAEERLEHAIDLCTYGRLGNINWDDPLSYFAETTLEIKKHESIIRCTDWDYRLAVIKAFLESIGTESVIEDIMGERYADVDSALTGRRKFAWDEKRDKVAAPETSQAAGTEISSIFPQNDPDEFSWFLRGRKRKRT